MDFTGKSLALSSEGISDVAARLSVGRPEIFSVLLTETSGAGFLSDRRPKILFERHYFSRLTRRRYDASHPGISAKTAGGYGVGGANQYIRLTEAIALDREAALRSASWGIGQIMGDNYKIAGFADVESMVAAMSDSEDAQLAALGAFVISQGIDRSLAAHDWAHFASIYNGANYAENNYDSHLEGNYQKSLAGATPDLSLRAVQLYLTFRNFDPYGIDGRMGKKTRSALIDFQNSAGLPATGEIDDATMQALLPG